MTALPVVGVGAWSPSLSPDGERVAYVSDRDGTPAVWVQPVDPRASPVRVPTGHDPVQEVRWSVDGAWLAVLVAPGGSPRTQVWVAHPDGGRLHRVAADATGATHLGPWTHIPGRLAVSSTTDPPSGVACIEDVATGERHVLARGGQPMVLDVDRYGRFALIRRGPRGARTVWFLDLTGGREVQLLRSFGQGSTDLGRLSPEARVAYVRSDAGREMHALFAVGIDAGGTIGEARLAAERVDGELEHLIVTSGGDAAMLLWNSSGRSACEHFDLATGARRPLLLPEPLAHEGSFSRDGRRLALTLEGPTHPRAVWLLDLESGEWRQLTSQLPGFRTPTAVPTLERFSAADGLGLAGWLYRAAPREAGVPGDDATARRGHGAAVVHLHGGPEAQERPVYNPLYQELAARGVAVFAPNVRGSSGYGRSFMEADNRERRWDAIADVGACVRYLVSTGVAAPGRVACAGRSYGGYLTLAALVFHPELFVAGIDVCGMADFQTFYANTEPWIAVAAYPKYGHPEADADLLRELSPIHRFDSLRAPLLVVHGRNDTNVPLEEAEQVVAAARDRGVPVQLLVFDDEGHEMLRPETRALFVATAVDWLSRIL